MVEIGDEPEIPRRIPADLIVVQTRPATVELRTPGGSHDVDVEFFRAENRYLSILDAATDLQTADSL